MPLLDGRGASAGYAAMHVDCDSDAVDDDVWPEFERVAAEARNRVEIRPARPEDGRRVLEALRVTTRSALGTFALHTAITLVDHGWIRLLGAGARTPGAACSASTAMGCDLISPTG
jgi:hypothetical protein